MQGLSHNNSERIGFVVASLMSGAIDASEVRRWAEHALVNTVEYPLWLVDLLDFNQEAFHIYKIIGFNPSSGLTVYETNALQGIALTRNRAIDTNVCTETMAKQTLNENPKILDRFKNEFPFLNDLVT